MADGGLPLTHRRGVREIARTLERVPSGALYFCVGRSPSSRAAVEAALRGALEGRRVTAVELAPDDDNPWRTILEGAAGGAVVSLSFAHEPPAPTLLARINVGREVGPAKHVAMLVWTGLGALRDLQRDAADMWAYRSGVVFFLGREDFELEARLLDAQATTLREALASTRATLAWATGLHRADVLVTHALLLTEMGRYRDALSAVDAAEAIVPSFPPSPRHVLYWGQVLCLAGESRRLRTYLAELEAAWKDPALSDVSASILNVLGIEASRAVRDWPAAFRAFESLRSTRGQGLAGGISPSCVNLADAMIRLGRLREGEALLREAEAIPDDDRDPALGVAWSALVLGGASASRASVLRARADTWAALASLHDAVRRLAGVGSLEKAIEALRLGATMYQDVGSWDDAVALRRQASHLEQEVVAMTGGAPEPALEDALAESSPSRRAECALDAATAALDAARPDEAARFLVAATAAHEEDEARFRSHYLAARIARLVARLALLRGRSDEALATLERSSVELDEAGLHRERIDTLLAIARLPEDAAPVEVRARAARSAWRIARGGGLLVPERDALILRARFARASGALEEAAAHEAVIAEIEEALTVAPAPQA